MRLRTVRLPFFRGLLLGLAVASLLAGGSGAAPPRDSPPAPFGSAVTSPVLIQDDQSLVHRVGTLALTMTDTVARPATQGPVHSYGIDLRTPLSNPLISLTIETTPNLDWSGPGQMPFGADNLPPLFEWTWWVTTGAGTNDTANWSLTIDGTGLERNATWVNGSWTFHGVTAPMVTVQVDPNRFDGSTAVGTGFVLNNPALIGTGPNSSYQRLGSSLHPALVRMSINIADALTGWDGVTGQPVFDFVSFDKQATFIGQIGASILLSIPVGTWGNGNTLPAGTPLNRSVAIGSGYFPTPGAFNAIVRGVANHTYLSSEPILYWSIGNEVPIPSSKAAVAYAQLLGVAVSALQHHRYPDARVGTDDSLDKNYLPTFAQYAPNLGFLSFHFYPSWGICLTANHTYCPPSGPRNGSPTPALLAHPMFTGSPTVLTPRQDQSAWANLTGHHLPIVVSETNIGATGGTGTPSYSTGTDPRQQALPGAAWIGSMMVDGSAQNLSAVTYFTLTSQPNLSGTRTLPYGGFGFGMTNVTPSGGTTYFAPYWALHLWGQYIPSGSPGRAINDSDPNSVRAYAVTVGTDVDVALVARVGANLSVRVSVVGNYSLQKVSVLDQNSYVEQYQPAANRTVVLQSGLTTPSIPSDGRIPVDGYGMAVAVFGPDHGAGGSSNGTGTNGSGHGPPPGGGNNSTSSTGSGSGATNGTGNSSGSVPPGSGTNGTTPGPSGPAPYGSTPVPLAHHRAPTPVLVPIAAGIILVALGGLALWLGRPSAPPKSRR